MGWGVALMADIAQSLSGFESRPTMDMDFMLRHLSNARDEVRNMVEEITAVNAGNDFVAFDIKGMEPIAEHREYNGIRIKLIGRIKNTRTPFDVDFGIGDVIVPRPEERKLRVQLDGFEEPEVLTYSLESIIAEKWDAILSRMELTSRMKDFYDIYYLACSYGFEARKLQEAIFETLQNRGTVYEKNALERVGGFIGVPFEAMMFERETFDVWNPEIMQYEQGSNNE